MHYPQIILTICYCAIASVSEQSLYSFDFGPTPHHNYEESISIEADNEDCEIKPLINEENEENLITNNE